MQELAHKFYNLFHGLDRAHGSYEITHHENGKLKGKAFTKHEPVTIQLWKSHLDGGNGLGIVPINEHNECVWGVIDVDKKEYPNINHANIERDINTYGLPLVVCRSKSGDAHLFLFTQAPIEARIMRQTLAAWAAELRFPKAEIFPKQDKLASEQDVGNWLNMPYHNANQTLRYGYRNGAAILSPEDFIQYCESKKVTLDFIQNFRIKCDPEFEDAPPCLQFYTKHGFPNNLNNALFSMGVFARMKFPDNWESKVDEYNLRFMAPGTSKEVQGIVKNLNKKSYYYKCKDEPLKSQCNKTVCKSRKYGVGDSGGDDIGLVIDGLQKLDTKPPIWFVNVLGQNGVKYRIELTDTGDLANQRGFNLRCMEAVNFLPVMIGAKEWRDLVQKALDNLEIIEAPAEASTEGALMESLQAFLTGRAQAKHREEIKTNRPWYDVDSDSYYFKADAFLGFIKQSAGTWFAGWTRQKFYSRLKDNGLTSEQLHGVGRVWRVSGAKIDKPIKELPIPNMESTDNVPF